eukprot:8306915-Pyramimonas_sp.AAC.1
MRNTSGTDNCMNLTTQTDTLGKRSRFFQEMCESHISLSSSSKLIHGPVNSWSASGRGVVSRRAALEEVARGPLPSGRYGWRGAGAVGRWWKWHLSREFGGSLKSSLKRHFPFFTWK